METATFVRAPISAIHSRNAEIAISRPIIMAAGMANNGAGLSCTSNTSATATMSLSATGSRKAPNGVVWFQRRAR